MTWLSFVAPGGVALHQIFDPDGGGVSHWFLAPGAQDRRALEPPADTKNWNPVLVADGTALAWIERERNAAGNISGSRLRVRSLTGGDERAIPIDLPPRAPLRLLDAAGPDGPFVVSRDYGPLIGLDDRGRVAWGPLQSGDMVSAGDAIRLTAGGWVAWDSYREAERYRVAWSLPVGAGRIEVPKGRAITAVAVNPAGTLIAVSVSRHLSVGAVRDAVFVLRSADGAELYRRYLRPYARSQLAFLGDGHLALTRQDGTRSRVEVLEVPATD